MPLILPSNLSRGGGGGRRVNLGGETMSRQAGVQRRMVNFGGARSRGRRSELLTMLAAAAAFFAIAVPTAAAVPFKAVVTVTPATSTLGTKITAAVDKSTKPT